MFNIILPKQANQNEYEELIKVFLQTGTYEMFTPEQTETAEANPSAQIISIQTSDDHNPQEEADRKEESRKNHIKRLIFAELKKATGRWPDWGILTGVRPVKLAGELVKREHSRENARDILIHRYCVKPEKADLVLDIYADQQKKIGPVPAHSVGLYLGIPFCPTRCVYCSFPANQAKPGEMTAYLASLKEEITFTASEMNRLGWFPESIYIGGGTPTTLDDKQLKELLDHLAQAVDLHKAREFTVEAGRPDTITESKLHLLKKYGVQRISINPQSMNSRTLQLIGRNHSPEEIITAFQTAKAVNFSVINADVIAGLPEESPEDFQQTLDILLSLEPENITVHTLALKRASKLKELDSSYHYHQGEIVREMLTRAEKQLYDAGYHPYYLYRQKQMAGNFENIGYAKAGTEGIYNVRIMEEEQTIVALGAGGISKLYCPEENRLERIANVSNVDIYRERLPEMLERKAVHLFAEGEGSC